jgi:hypothetical protein
MAGRLEDWNERIRKVSERGLGAREELELQPLLRTHSSIIPILRLERGK